jgi:hypothetical protein
VYQKWFAHMFADIRENNARRYCAMGLVKICGDYTWAQAAELLELPISSASAMANRATCILTQQSMKKAFGRALHQAAQQFSSSPNKINYAERRKRFARLIDIPRAEWATLCAVAGIGPGVIGSRSRYATAWLWAELTGGDWTLAPGLQIASNSINAREVFRQLSKKVLPALAPHLVSYAARRLL